jgi:hypothetical protein
MSSFNFMISMFLRFLLFRHTSQTVPYYHVIKRLILGKKFACRYLASPTQNWMCSPLWHRPYRRHSYARCNGPSQRAEAVRQPEAGEAMVDIARSYDVNHATISRLLAHHVAS